MHYSKIIGIALLSGFLLTGCGKKEPEASNTDTTADLSVKVKAEWEEFKRDVQVQIDTNEARIKRLRDRATNGDDKKVDSLEAKNKSLKQRLAEFRADADTSWQSFKQEFKRDMDQLGTAIADIFRDNP